MEVRDLIDICINMEGIMEKGISYKTIQKNKTLSEFSKEEETSEKKSSKKKQ